MTVRDLVERIADDCQAQRTFLFGIEQLSVHFVGQDGDQFDRVLEFITRGRIISNEGPIVDLVIGKCDAIPIFGNYIEAGGFVHTADQYSQVFERHALEGDGRCDLAGAALDAGIAFGGSQSHQIGHRQGQIRRRTNNFKHGFIGCG